MSYGLGFLSATAPWTGSVAASISFTDSAQSTNNNTSYTFSNLSVGTAATNRVVAVTIYSQSASAVSTVTIGGISATKAVEIYYTDAASVVAIYYAVVPTGTTASVVVNLADQAGRCAVGVYRIIPGYSSTPVSTVSGQATQSVSEFEVTGGASVYLFIENANTAYTPTRNTVSLTTDASSTFGGPKLVKYGNYPVTGDPNAGINSTYASGTGSNNCAIIVSHWK